MSKQSLNKAHETLNNNQLNKVAGGKTIGTPTDLPPDLPPSAKTWTNKDGITYHRLKDDVWEGPDENGAYG